MDSTTNNGTVISTASFVQYLATIWLYVFLIGLFVVCVITLMVIGFIRRSNYLLKVRGWMLFIQQIMLVVYATVPIIGSLILLAPSGAEVYCYLTIYFFEPIIVFLAALIFLRTFRNLIITNINNQMEKYADQLAKQDNEATSQDEEMKMIKMEEVTTGAVTSADTVTYQDTADADLEFIRLKKTLKFFRQVMSIKVLASVCFIIMLAWYVAMSIIIGVYQGNCIAGSYAIYITYVLFVSILIICCAIMITYDVIANRSTLINFRRCGGFLSFWWQDDNYLFRLEGLFVAITTAFIIIYEQLLVWIDTFNYAVRVKYPWISILIYFIILFSMLFAFAGFIIIVALIKERLEHNKLVPVPNADQKQIINDSTCTSFLDWILDEKEMSSAFQTYAKGEWSLENVLVVLQIRVFRKISTNNKKKKKKKATDIADTFLRENSPMEVNIPGRVRNEVLENVDKSQAVDDGVFEKTYKEAQFNLSDTCSRFMKTETYSQILAKVRKE